MQRSEVRGPEKQAGTFEMDTRMQAFVMTGSGQGSIRELDRFEPAPGEVVLRARAAAICTTERRIFSGDVAIPFPVIGGHEVSGTVVEVADEGCGLKAGDRRPAAGEPCATSHPRRTGGVRAAARRVRRAAGAAKPRSAATVLAH